VSRNLSASPALFLLALTGCVVGPGYQPPKVAVPSGWSEAPAASEPAPETPSHWWTAFGDPELDSLIDRAARANLDVQLAEARVSEARANRLISKAALLPQAGATGSYARSKQGTLPPTSLFQAGLDASWEIDVFGGNRRAVEAANADLAASIYDRGDVLLTLLAEVATNYIDLRGYQRQLEVARQNLASQRDTLDLTQARYQGGLGTDLAVAQAEAQVETTASTIPTLEISAGDAVHRLGVLLGEPPSSLVAELSASSPIPAAPSALPAGLPSDLLRRRPDVRRSERQLAAATARIGVATADLYPKFSLTGSAGLSSASTSNLFSAASRLLSIGPSFTWPIFQGGQIRANIEVHDAQAQQALIVYRQSILTAMEDAENAILSFNRERDRREILAAAARSNERAAQYATQLYLRGLSDFLSVLDAQRNLFAAQTSLAQSETAVSADLVALHKALGGGWEAFPLTKETPENPAPSASSTHPPTENTTKS